MLQYLVDTHLDIVITLVLAVLAIAIALWERSQHRHTKRQLAATLEKTSNAVVQLEMVTNSLSTRYIGPFPEYLENINSLLSHAQPGDTVLIAYVTPVIGIFSKPVLWNGIKSSMQRILMDDQNISVRAIFPSLNDTSRRFFKDQFRAEIEDWDNWRKTDPSAISRINSISKRYGTTIPASAEEFIEMFITASNAEVKSTYSGTDIKYVGYRPPVYLWILEDIHRQSRNEAIFAIPALTPNFGAQAFWTSDYSIIKALSALHNEYWNDTLVK